MSRSILLAMMAATAISTLFTTGVQAQQANNHWFYGQWRDYDERNYNDRFAPRDNGPARYYNGEEEEYFIPERIRRLRMQRWQARRRLFAPRRFRYEDEYAPDLPSPRDFARSPSQARPITRPATRPRVRLSYVPLPRKKPGFLYSDRQPAKTASLPAEKRQINIARLPEPNSDAGLAVVKPRIPDPVETASIPEIDPVVRKAKPKIASKPEVKLPPTTKVAIAKPETGKITVKKPVAKKQQTAKKRKRIEIEVKARQRTPVGAISCKKAQSIVRDFGFSNIQAKNCNGTVYSFSANRDGKPFSVKLSSLSGELKDIRQTN